jgi:hypothetical protein
MDSPTENKQDWLRKTWLTLNLKKISFILRKLLWAMWGLRFSRRWGWWCVSGFWRHVDSSVDASVSEKHTVSNFSPEDADIMFLRNVGNYRRVYTAPKPRRTTSLPWTMTGESGSDWLWAGRSGFYSWQVQEFFSSLPRSDRLRPAPHHRPSYLKVIVGKAAGAWNDCPHSSSADI